MSPECILDKISSERSQACISISMASHPARRLSAWENAFSISSRATKILIFGKMQLTLYVYMEMMSIGLLYSLKSIFMISSHSGDSLGYSTIAAKHRVCY